MVEFFRANQNAQNQHSENLRNFIVRFGPWAVHVAQLVEGSLPTPEVCDSNSVIGKHLYETFVSCQLNRKVENKEKEAGMTLFKIWVLDSFMPQVTAVCNLTASPSPVHFKLGKNQRFYNQMTE